MIKNFSTQNLRDVFAEENKFNSFRRVASNLVRGIDTYEVDEDGNEKRVSKAEANRAIRKVFMQICGLTEEDLKSRKRRHRAIELHTPEIFEIIEDDIEFEINEGWQQNEWFQNYVEMKSTALGDENAFYIEDEQYLIVGNTSGDHHDITMQQIGAGSVIHVAYKDHSVKIGKDIDLIILGRYDYNKLIGKVADAYQKDIMDAIFADVYAASAKLPASMKKSGALSAATKANFDQLIENVEMVNGSGVIIMGTKNALKKITALADVDWATNEQKAQIVATGRLGNYEGTTLMEVPQRLKIGADLDTLAATDLLLPNDKLLIIPVNDDRFVKFFDLGESELRTVEDKGDLKDDFNIYEVRRAYGHEIVLGRYFGEWTIE